MGDAAEKSAETGRSFVDKNAPPAAAGARGVGARGALASEPAVAPVGALKLETASPSEPALPAKPLPFSVMVKPVGSLCNLRCSYCYYRQPAERLSSPQPEQLMGDEVLERFIRQYIEASTGPEVSFVWHGGEPSLAGLDFYRRVVELQQRYLPEGWACWNNLQTNGVLLDDEWCAFLAEAGFDVGLSLDGTEALHDRYRLWPDGQGSYQAVYEACLRLKAHGIRADLLCTVNASTTADPLAAYRALRELDTGWVQFIPIVRRQGGGGGGGCEAGELGDGCSGGQFLSTSATPDSVSAEGYGDLLVAVFDEWSTNDVGRLDVQLFAEMARILGGGGAGLCWMAPTCGRALIVEADGSVYSCDHFVTDEHRIGHISETHLGELAASPVQEQFSGAKRDGLPDQCLSCEWLAVCNGGCPKDRFILSDDGQPGLNYLCAGLRRFFAYAQPRLLEAGRLRGQGMSAQAIMQAMRALHAASWQGVGRNDPCPCGSGRKAKACCWPRRP